MYIYINKPFLKQVGKDNQHRGAENGDIKNKKKTKDVENHKNPILSRKRK